MHDAITRVHSGYSKRKKMPMMMMMKTIKSSGKVEGQRTGCACLYCTYERFPEVYYIWGQRWWWGNSRIQPRSTTDRQAGEKPIIPIKWDYLKEQASREALSWWFRLSGRPRMHMGER